MSRATLGGIITQSAGLSRYDRAWAAVIAAALLGMALYALVLLIERLVLRGTTPPYDRPLTPHTDELHTLTPWRTA